MSSSPNRKGLIDSNSFYHGACSSFQQQRTLAMDYPSLAALLPSGSTLGGFVSWADLLLSSNPIRKGLIDNNPFYRWTCSIRKSSQQKTLLQLDELLHLKSLFTHSPNTKYSNNPHKYFPHITQIFSMSLGSHKYSLYISS